MEKNIIITGPTGVGKSVIIAHYWAENWKDAKLLDGVELKENSHLQFSDEEVAQLKGCRVLILDSMFLKFPLSLQCMKTILEILEFRYTTGKIIVIAEQSTIIIQKMNIPVLNSILKHSYHLQLTTLDDTDAARTKLEKLLKSVRIDSLMDGLYYFFRKYHNDKIIGN